MAPYWNLAPDEDSHAAGKKLIEIWDFSFVAVPGSVFDTAGRLLAYDAVVIRAMRVPKGVMLTTRRQLVADFIVQGCAGRADWPWNLGGA